MADLLPIVYGPALKVESHQCKLLFWIRFLEEINIGQKQTEQSIHIALLLHYLQATKYLDDGTKFEILELLGHFEGELQARDIAIATLKVRYS